MGSQKVWGIHMDISVGTKPIDENFIGIGWPQMGDLSVLGKNRKSFKKRFAESLPNAKKGAIPVQAGILFRFVHELAEGDVVVYPSKVDRMVNIGKVSGPYNYAPEKDNYYPNRRKIEWIKHLPRDEFSQSTLYEIGAFITLFSVRKHADKFLEKLNGKASKATIDDEEVLDDDTVAGNITEQAEETARDFVIRRLKSNINPFEFEHFIAHLMECMGYHTRVTAKSGDGGVDIIAHKDQLGFEPPLVKVQCKQSNDNTGRPKVTELFGNIEDGEHGLFVTLGGYSKNAREYARAKPNLRLLNGDHLVDLIFENYEKVAPRFQTIIPMKQIYVPTPDDGI